MGFEQGWSREDVQKYRDELLKRFNPQAPVAPEHKRPRGDPGRDSSLEEAQDVELHTVKIWSHDDLLQAKGPSRSGAADLPEKPSHWPPHVDVDPGRWVDWLPPDWGQGTKLTESGNPLKTFVSPEGKP